MPAAARAGPKMLLEGLGDEGPEEPTLLEASQPNASPEVLGHASVQVHQGLGTRVAGGRGVAARCHGRSSQFPVARAFLRGYPPFLRCRAIVPGRVECPRGRVGRRIAVEAYVPPCAFGQASSEVTPRIPAMCENQQENSPADRHSKPINTTWGKERCRTRGHRVVGSSRRPAENVGTGGRSSPFQLADPHSSARPVGRSPPEGLLPQGTRPP